MINVDKYKKEGKFIPLVHDHEDFWYTPIYQKYLEEFYALSEAMNQGLLNSTEWVFYMDLLSEKTWEKYLKAQKPGYAIIN